MQKLRSEGLARHPKFCWAPQKAYQCTLAGWGNWDWRSACIRESSRKICALFSAPNFQMTSWWDSRVFDAQSATCQLRLFLPRSGLDSLQRSLQSKAWSTCWPFEAFALKLWLCWDTQCPFFQTSFSPGGLSHYATRQYCSKIFGCFAYSTSCCYFHDSAHEDDSRLEGYG